MFNIKSIFDGLLQDRRLAVNIVLSVALALLLQVVLAAYLLSENRERRDAIRKVVIAEQRSTKMAPMMARLEATFEFEKASTHWMRHTFVRQALVDGVPIEVASELAGHASIDTTSIYSTQELARKIKAVQGMRRRVVG
jgi:site-specific recombinase XerD